MTARDYKMHDKVSIEDGRVGRIVRIKHSKFKGTFYTVSIDSGPLVQSSSAYLTLIEPAPDKPKKFKPTPQVETLFPLEEYDNRYALKG